MKVTFTAAHDAEIHSVYHWLRSDRDLVRHVRVGAPTGNDHEAMGAVDTVSAVCSTAFGLGQLAFAFISWRQSRPAGSTVTITRPDGARLTITGAQDVTTEALTLFLSAPEPARKAQPAGEARPAGKAVPAKRRQRRS